MHPSYAEGTFPQVVTEIYLRLFFSAKLFQPFTNYSLRKRKKFQEYTDRAQECEHHYLPNEIAVP